MDRAFWRKIASSWVTIRSAAEKGKTTQTAQVLFQQAIDSRQEERSIIDLLMQGIEEEDDDDSND